MSLLLFAANDGEEVVCNRPSEVENSTFLTSAPRIFVNCCQPPVHHSNDRNKIVCSGVRSIVVDGKRYLQ